ncbi:MAG TPA: primosomal protein N' [Acidothermaceae bacterium]
MTTRRAAAAAPAKPAKRPAALFPVARVAVDVALPHLDRLYDYLVPETLASQAVAGSRVRVRFAGQLVDGFVVERLASSDHEGRLAFIERSVSAEVVLTPAVLRLARAVADRWAGTLADVLRLAIPPRHARAETAAARPVVVEDPRQSSQSTTWARYASGERLLTSLAAGGSPRAVWAALPGGSWPAEIADLVAAATVGGRGTLVVVPDHRDVARVDAAVTDRLGAGRHVVLTADLGPAERYRRYLAVSRGDVRVVVGTRAAAFAPVADLGLVVMWDDGDDLHAEPRAPYPHAREVLLLRAHLESAAAVIGGHAVTAEGANLVASGWAAALGADRTVTRAVAPRVFTGDDAAAGRQPESPARLPSRAWRAAHESLRAGAPVLVQVPRRGYLPALSCDRCRASLRCPACAGPLAATDATRAPTCRWCGRLAAGWSCPECGASRYRAVVVGATRTAEELGRAFPGVPVRTSAQGQVLDAVPAGAALVIATPGAEPVADGGYGAALLLDGWALLGRADLRAAEETLRRWLNAAALVRSADDGGLVVVLADAALPPVQALVRWSPGGYADRELAERRRLRFPPAAVFAELTGEPAAVEEWLQAANLPASLPASSEILGPVPARVGEADAVRALIRAPRAAAPELAAALHAARGVRSAHKLQAVRVRVDPIEIG